MANQNITLHNHPLPSNVQIQPLVFALNEKRITISPFDRSIPFDATLLEYLREHAHLSGTKLGCGEGGCGACTVVILRHKSESIRINEKETGVGNGLPYEIKAVNACLMPLLAVHGSQVITIEGIGNAKNPHAIQQRLAFLFGSQCGFCTPGIVMSFYATLRNSAKTGLTEREIERSMDGNLCRCTGYRPILDALKTFAKQSTGTPSSEKTESTNCDWEIDAIKARRNNEEDSADAFTCPRGEDCCRVKNRSNSPSIESSSSSISSGHDSGFATSSIPLPKSSLDLAKTRVGAKTDEENGLLPYEAAKEPIFPPWLCKTAESDPWGRSRYDAQDLAFVDVAHVREGEEFVDDETEPKTIASKPGTIWLRPSTVTALLSMIRYYTEQGQAIKMRSGDSECRIEVKFLKRKYDVNIFVGNLPTLSFVERTADKLLIGANMPLQDVMGQIRNLSRTENDDYAKQVYRAILSNAAHFASTQIRNVACIGGNVATASPISDLNPVWMAVNASVHYLDAEDKSASSERDLDLLSSTSTVPMAEFFKGYRKTALPSSGVISHLTIPLAKPEKENRIKFIRAYKQAKRKDDDIAIVTCCLFVDVQREDEVKDQWKIIDARLAYGGMAPTTVYAKKTQDALIGKTIIHNGTIDQNFLSQLLDCMAQEDFDLKFNVPGGMAVYRKSLALGFLVKFVSELAQELHIEDSIEQTHSKSPLPAFAQIASSHLQRPITRGSQSFEHVVVKTKNGSGASVPNLSSLKQCTGEAEYVDDQATLHDELIGALVLSTKANAKILKVDSKPALAPHGPATHFIGLEDVKRLGGKNIWCPPAVDDHFFCDGFSEAVGLPIGVVLAPSRREALDAARLVKVEYESVGEPILDIDTAIEKESFFSCRPKIQQGSTEMFEDWSDCDHVLEGETRLGGQEHFYLETNAVLCIPGKEDDQMEVWSSTQNPNETQATIADICNIPVNRITVKTKRLGGGFGGKESRSCSLAAPMALASYISGRPVRCMLDRDEDIAISGQRHPFKSTWKIGFTSDGRVRKLDAKVYNNGGWSQDLSRAVVERAMTHLDGVYRFDALRVHGFICKTNTVSNTAFRGFGGPQGMMIIEDAMEKAARSIGVPPEDMRLKSMSIEGDRLHYGQQLLDWNVPKMWESVMESSDYKARRSAVEKFNAMNRWKKRGLTINGTRFGISFTALFLNQARVLIHIYAHDGSIMLSHGGVEMGQGLYSKTAQIASTELGVPLDKIHIAYTSTREVANAAPTAASAGSDLNGAACKDACDQLNERLAPFKKEGKSFEEAVHDAYFARVNLSAVGHYKTDVKGMDWETGKGEPFAYWTQGVVAAEAEIDVLTGDSRIVRTDIMMDIARSINPGIDCGQIEGAIMQGIGLVTTEESLWRPTGQIATTGPGNYKIPAFLDTPADFRVSFMKQEEGRKTHYLRTIHSSRGIGEPPLAAGAFHFFAIKDAIASARKDAGLGQKEFQLHSPATAERIRLACADSIIAKAQIGAEQNNKDEKSFFVTIM